MSATLHRTDYPALPDTDYRLYEAGSRDGYGEAFDADQMRAYVDADRAARWQPIEAAPKNGVWQDGHNHYGEYILVWYRGALRPLRARWWFRDDTDACNFLADGGWAVFPEVYMPLPLPPAPNQGEDS